jgi:hypothetical protein
MPTIRALSRTVAKWPTTLKRTVILTLVAFLAVG